MMLTGQTSSPAPDARRIITMSVSSHTETRQGIFAMLVSLPMAASLAVFVWMGSGLLI